MDDFIKEVLKKIDNNDLVITDRIIFSNISYEIRNKSNKTYMPYIKGEPIKNHFQMSSPLSNRYQNDFYLIGDLGSVSYLLEDNRAKLINEFDVPFNSTKLKFYEVVFQ